MREFWRSIYRLSLLAAWAGLLAWLLCALLLAGGEDKGSARQTFEATLAGGLLGGCVGAALCVAGAWANGQLRTILLALAAGSAGGILAGCAGAFLGETIYAAHMPRALGWAAMGLLVGIIDGILDASFRKVRNGAIGGFAGGLLGGLAFGLLAQIAPGTGSAGRAFGFACLGALVGFGVALTQTLFRQAWLTVVDGYRPGRRLVLEKRCTEIGSADYAALTFPAAGSPGVGDIHAVVEMARGGRYTLADRGSPGGTYLNQNAIGRDPVLLASGDVIRVGIHRIRFVAKGGAETPPTPSRDDVPAAGIRAVPPPRPKIATAERPAGVPPAPPTPAATRVIAPPPPPVRPLPPPPPVPPRQTAPAIPKAALPPPPPPAPPPVAVPPRPAAIPPRPPVAPLRPVAAPAPPPVAKPPLVKSADSPLSGGLPKPAAEGCPGCGKSHPGPKGQRYCMICDRTY